jgi:hypothetical protein
VDESIAVILNLWRHTAEAGEMFEMLKNSNAETESWSADPRERVEASEKREEEGNLCAA